MLEFQILNLSRTSRSVHSPFTILIMFSLVNSSCVGPPSLVTTKSSSPICPVTAYLGSAAGRNGCRISRFTGSSFPDVGDCVEKILVFPDKLGNVGENELHVAKREANATVEIARKLYVILLCCAVSQIIGHSKILWHV